MKLSDLDQHALRLGQIIGNLHSLELLLRIFLLRKETQVGSQEPALPEISQLGEQVTVSSLTNFDSLRTLIANYNEVIDDEDRALRVEPDVADLRDAIAHGRVLSPNPVRPLRLFKFSKPAQGRVTVTHALVMTDDWFDEQRRFVAAEIKKVQTALESA